MAEREREKESDGAPDGGEWLISAHIHQWSALLLASFTSPTHTALLKKMTFREREGKRAGERECLLLLSGHH